jgi:TonB family protein
MYVAAAARERVQGTVLLAALILKDGSVANIRVVRSLDARLDSSAVSALTQWHFRPATRNGAPVDLEVLVQIPFRLPSF